MSFKVGVYWIGDPQWRSPHWAPDWIEWRRPPGRDVTDLVDSILQNTFEWENWLPAKRPFETMSISLVPLSACASKIDKLELIGRDLWVTVGVEAEVLASFDSTLIVAEVQHVALSAIRVVCAKFGLPYPSLNSNGQYSDPGDPRPATRLGDLWDSRPPGPVEFAVLTARTLPFVNPSEWVEIGTTFPGKHVARWFGGGITESSDPVDEMIEIGDLRPGPCAVEQLMYPKSTTLAVLVGADSDIGRAARMRKVDGLCRMVADMSQLALTSSGRDHQVSWAMFHRVGRTPTAKDFQFIGELL